MIPHLTHSRRALPGVSLALAILSTLPGQLAAQNPEPDAIAWQDEYVQALEDAQAANRLLWIQFTGPWCPNCTRMEQESFPHPSIVDHARRSFVPLKLRSDTNEQLAVAFGLTAIPATIIVAPNRDIIAMRQGYLGPAELDAFLSDALARSPRKTAAAKPAVVPMMAVAGPALALPVITRSTTKNDDDPRAEKPLALRGFCPVSLVGDRKLVAGRPEHSVTHQGRIYRFCNSSMSDRFQKEPQRFVPANGGFCPVIQLERGLLWPGDPRFGVIFGGHLYLCASAEDRRRFLEDPAQFERVSTELSRFLEVLGTLSVP